MITGTCTEPVRGEKVLDDCISGSFDMATCNYKLIVMPDQDGVQLRARLHGMKEHSANPN